MSNVRTAGTCLLTLLLIGNLYPLPAQENGKQKALEILAERGELILEIYTREPAEIKRINKILSPDRMTPGGFVAYASMEGFRKFLEMAIPYRILEQPSTGRESEWAQKSPGFRENITQDAFPGNWNTYPSHSQYLEFMVNTVGTYPDICILDTLGYSIQGRPILSMKISDNPAIREAEPAFVYSSTMHGDETSGYFLLLRLIDYLCENYGVSDQVTGLIDGLEIWINPLANPDGTYLGADSMPDFPKRFNSNHVDLNRNFPALTGSLHPDGNPYQSETLVQMKFLRGINLVSGANLHSGEEVVNYPFDAWELPHADEAWYRHVSSEYARQARQRAAPVLYMNGFDMGITRGWEWYQVLGSRQDWINYYLHARELTLEISLDKHPPAPELPWYWYVNYPSLLGYMEQTLYGIQGVIYDGESGAPLRASVIIPDHDTLNSWIYSDSLTGFFARPIAEGSWDLAVSAPGYRTFRSSSIHLNYEETVFLEIPMTRDENKFPTNTAIFVNPNPFQTATRLTLSDGKPGNYRLRIFDLRGSLLVDESFRVLPAGSMNYPIDGSRLPEGVSILRLDTPDGPLVEKIFKLQ